LGGNWGWSWALESRLERHVTRSVAGRATGIAFESLAVFGEGGGEAAGVGDYRGSAKDQAAARRVGEDAEGEVRVGGGESGAADEKGGVEDSQGGKLRGALEEGTSGRADSEVVHGILSCLRVSLGTTD
jgi:hypothetical protein